MTDLFAEIPIFTHIKYERSRLTVIYLPIGVQDRSVLMDRYYLSDEYVMRVKLNHIL